MRTSAAPMDRVHVPRVIACLVILSRRAPSRAAPRPPLLFSAKAGKKAAGGRSRSEAKATEKQCSIRRPARLRPGAGSACHAPLYSTPRPRGSSVHGPGCRVGPDLAVGKAGPPSVTPARRDPSPGPGSPPYLACTASVLLAPLRDRHALPGVPWDPTDRGTGSVFLCAGRETPRCCCGINPLPLSLALSESNACQLNKRIKIAAARTSRLIPLLAFQTAERSSNEGGPRVGTP